MAEQFGGFENQNKNEDIKNLEDKLNNPELNEEDINWILKYPSDIRDTAIKLENKIKNTENVISVISGFDNDRTWGQKIEENDGKFKLVEYATWNGDKGNGIDGYNDSKEVKEISLPFVIIETEKGSNNNEYRKVSYYDGEGSGEINIDCFENSKELNLSDALNEILEQNNKKIQKFS